MLSVFERAHYWRVVKASGDNRAIAKAKPPIPASIDMSQETATFVGYSTDNSQDGHTNRKSRVERDSHFVEVLYNRTTFVDSPSL